MYERAIDIRWKLIKASKVPSLKEERRSATSLATCQPEYDMIHSSHAETSYLKAGNWGGWGGEEGQGERATGRMKPTHLEERRQKESMTGRHNEIC